MPPTGIVQRAFSNQDETITAVKSDTTELEKKVTKLQAEVNSLFDRQKIQGEARDRAVAKYATLDKEKIAMRLKPTTEDLH